VKEKGSQYPFVCAYIFLGKKRVLEKIYYNINNERKTIVEYVFICRREPAVFKELIHFFVRLSHIIIVNPVSFRIK